MTTPTYDAIIVGAGPAGASAAYFLGEAGRRVLVLEKETLPRYKPCGGGVAARTLAQFPFSFDAVIESRVRSFSYAFGEHTVTVPLTDNPVYMVMRDRFDAHLLRHARADVRDGTAVKNVTELPDRVEESGGSVIVETDAGDTFTAPYLIGADGAHSQVARSVGLWRKRRLAAAIEAEVTPPAETMRWFDDAPLFIFGEIERGYLWIFPKGDHLSVGIGAYRPEAGELQAALARVMARYGIALDEARVYGHTLPFYDRHTPIASARTLLAGDAAALVDPLSGEGIRPAITSGRLAAESLLAGQPERYPAMVHRHFGRSHTIGLGVAQLFYHFPRACFYLGSRNPFATPAFVDLLAGSIGYSEVLLRLFGTLPLYLLTETAAGIAGVLGGPKQRRHIRTLMYHNM